MEGHEDCYLSIRGGRPICLVAICRRRAIRTSRRRRRWSSGRALSRRAGEGLDKTTVQKKNQEKMRFIGSLNPRSCVLASRVCTRDGGDVRRGLMNEMYMYVGVGETDAFLFRRTGTHMIDRPIESSARKFFRMKNE